MRLMLGLALMVGAAPMIPASATTSQATAPAAAPEKLVCKRNKEAETGSNLRRGSKRVCKLASVWKAEEDELRKDLDNVRERGTHEGAPSPAQGPSPSPQ
jgi:hypothetical protein